MYIHPIINFGSDHYVTYDMHPVNKWGMLRDEDVDIFLGWNPLEIIARPESVILIHADEVPHGHNIRHVNEN